jgi:hypothetical protein
MIQRMRRQKLECTGISDDTKARMIERLNALDDKERMILLNKYTRQTEDIYCTFSAKDNMDIINKILLLKHSKNALIESYAKGDPVVDHPGCRLNEFLNSEMAN